MENIQIKEVLNVKYFTEIITIQLRKKLYYNSKTENRRLNKICLPLK